MFAIFKSCLWTKNIVNSTKILLFKSLVQSVMLYGAENRRVANTLLATEMDFWQKAARKSRNEKIMNLNIKDNFNVQHNIIEIIVKRILRWFGHLKRVENDGIPKQNCTGMEFQGQKERGEAWGQYIKGVSSLTNGRDCRPKYY